MSVSPLVVLTANSESIIGTSPNFLMVLTLIDPNGSGGLVVEGTGIIPPSVVTALASAGTATTVVFFGNNVIEDANQNLGATYYNVSCYLVNGNGQIAASDGTIISYTQANPFFTQNYQFTNASGTINLIDATPYNPSVGPINAPTVAANEFYGGPTTGSPAAPSFRALVTADLPSSLGNTNITSINGAIVFADQMSGADWGAKVATAYAQLPAEGGTIDARGLVGTQSIGSALTLGNTSESKAVSVLIGTATITVNAQITLLGNIKFSGISPNSTEFITGSGLTNQGTFVLGDNAHLYDSIVLEDFFINCNLVTGSTAIQGYGLNEGSAIRRLTIDNYETSAININGATINTANFPISELQIGAWTSSGNAIVLTDTSNLLLRRITVVSNSGSQVSASGIQVAGTTISSCTIIGLHVEKHTNSVLVTSGSATIVNAEAENGTTNTINIGSGASAVVVTGALNNANSGSSYIVTNAVTGTNIASTNPPAPGGYLPFYIWGTGGSEIYQTATGLVGSTFVATGSTPTVSSGQVGLGTTTATTATGGSETLPSNPVGFLEVNIGGTTRKIPYYAS
jgi:hypothetical protein